ncbi:hypothetical protein PO883_09540 [Massilia sp. DJPM01]|uniref:hypothetical protein n=1 Tax=Massilia sp. DJPM01 TaxID=3024404 RepID=UPI00259FC21D|nr:hypothetical protein [Massilia sp. DJPM01]MDM5177432.1 hypothetical protein [Massilia sp. DJPM01]
MVLLPANADCRMFGAMAARVSITAMRIETRVSAFAGRAAHRFRWPGAHGRGLKRFKLSRINIFISHE